MHRQGEGVEEMSDARAVLAENSRLSQQLKQKEFELNVLYDIANSISYSLSYDDFLRIVVDSLHKIIDYDVCSFLLLPEEGKAAKMVIRIARAVSKEAVDEVKAKVIDALSSFRDRPLLEQDIVFEYKGEFSCDAATAGKGIVSSFDVPLMVRNKVVGLLNVASARDIAYSDDEMKLLYTLASQASSAVERLQAVLSVEKSKMRVMVEGMSEGVAMFDENERLVIINSAFREMLGDNLSLIGPLEEIRKYRDAPRLQDIQLTKPFPRIIHSQSKCLEDETGKLVGIVVLLRDVSREREVDQMKSDFVSVVSHELRTPLAAMKGAVDNLLDGLCGDLNQIQRDCLLLTNRNIGRLNRLISDLLDISRIEAGKIQLAKQQVDITRVINEVLDSFQAMANEKNILLKASCGSDLPMAELDPDKITQVLTNLVGNSLKFTPSGGTVKVEACRENNVLQIDVIDTGVGIPRQDLEKVFDKFYQVSRSLGSGVKGTGLGLPISKSLVEKHGGKMWAESELGKGSTFRVNLPLR